MSKVLVVDDLADNRTLLAQDLEENGYEGRRIPFRIFPLRIEKIELEHNSGGRQARQSGHLRRSILNVAECMSPQVITIRIRPRSPAMP